MTINTPLWDDTDRSLPRDFSTVTMTGNVADLDAARFRRNDPITSQEAAESNDVQRSVEAVYSALAFLGPSADHEIVNHLEKASYWSPSRIRTARKTLERQGRVRFTGLYHLTPSGRRTRVWEVA